MLEEAGGGRAIVERDNAHLESCVMNKKLLWMDQQTTSSEDWSLYITVKTMDQQTTSSEDWSLYITVKTCALIHKQWTASLEMSRKQLLPVFQSSSLNFGVVCFGRRKARSLNLSPHSPSLKPFGSRGLYTFQRRPCPVFEKSKHPCQDLIALRWEVLLMFYCALFCCNLSMSSESVGLRHRKSSE